MSKFIQQRAFVDNNNFLFSFEENYCWITPITSRSLRWTCSIARYVWTIFLAFQKRSLQGWRQGTWKPPKKFEAVELQALLDEDVSQTQKQLAEQLVISQQVVSDRRRQMGKIQMIARWVLHELNDRQIEKRKTHMTFCSLGTKWSHFYIVQLQKMKSKFILRIPSANNHG